MAEKNNKKNWLFSNPSIRHPSFFKPDGLLIINDSFPVLSSADVHSPASLIAAQMLLSTVITINYAPPSWQEARARNLRP